MSDLHCRRASFGAVAAEYERGRPGYPDEAVAWLAERLRIEPGRDVLDLGAGTGKLTRQLVSLGARVLAVEPLDGMRAELERAVPGAGALPGTAEAIPVGDASIDAVTCAQSFHWFEPSTALLEIHRVLRQRGFLGLIWNVRDQSDPLNSEISRIVSEEPGALGDTEATLEVVARSGLFRDPERMACDYRQLLSGRELVDRVASMSVVAVKDVAERAHVTASIEALAQAAGEPIRLTYRTEVFAFERIN